MKDLMDLHAAVGADKLLEHIHANCELIETAPEPCKPRSLMEIAPNGPDHSQTVLGNRFLCAGGSMLFVGPSGIGKSSASVQQDVLWSLGREAFGIRPTKPLRILTVQAENDDGDIAEMRDGVCRGLRLSDKDRELVASGVFYVHEDARTGAKFLARIQQLLASDSFDLLRIDPFMAYLGGDVTDTEHTAGFLRNGLNPILSAARVACVLNHHTPKVTNRDTSNWRGSDWMYAGAGGADVTNWARAALVIDPTHAPHVFRFIAAKRGGRIGWIDESGERETVRYYCHASDGLYWRPGTADDLQELASATAAKKCGREQRTKADLKALVPMSGAIPKRELLEIAKKGGFSRDGAAAALSELLRTAELFLWHVPRPRTNPEPRISRHEQTLTEAPE